MARSWRSGRGWWSAASVWVLSVLGSSTAAAQAGAPSAIERYQLGNGLRVVLAPDRVTPGVSVVVRYGLGAAHAPRGYRGMTHLLEHLTFRGSRHVEPLQGMTILQELGAGFNAVTSLEETRYFTQVAAPALETALWLESERMAFTLGRLDQAALDLERRIVDNEHRQRFRYASNFVARHWLHGLYGDGHPFVDDPAQVDDVSNVTLPGVQWFFQTGYRPDNATLALVGKLDIASTRALIEKYFGPIVSPRVPRASLLAPAPRLCGLHRLEVSHAGIFGHSLRITWPRNLATTAAESASAEVLAQLLERRLHGLLVEHSAEVAGVVAAVTRFATHELLTVDFELHEEANAAAVEEVALREARALSKTAPSERELRVVRSNLLTEAIFAREDGVSRAQALAAGRDPDSEVSALPLLTAPQVVRAAQPLGGPLLVLHIWASKQDDGRTRVEKEVNPCP